MNYSARRSFLAGEGIGLRALGGTIDLGFQLYGRLRARELADADPVRTQERTLRSLIRRACATRFGRDHRFASIGSVAEFQRSVRLRTYEALWDEYLRACYPVVDNVTWPGQIRFIALTSGTTEGATKYIPVSAEMMASNRKAARTMLAAFASSRPDSRLFRGRLFFLGGSTALAEPAPGVLVGDLSGIAAMDLAPLWRAFTFPPLELALETDWDRKLSRLAESCCGEPITLISGVPSWLLLLFQRVLAATGKSTIAEVWPGLELVVHGGVKFDPYRESFHSILGSPKIQLQETYPCSEGFIAFGDSHSGLLRLLFDHGLFYEFVPVEELDATWPTRHWLATAEVGVNYAIVVSTCAGMWAHQIGDTVRFESLDPPVIMFTGRTRYTLSAFGEHLISEEVEAAIALASSTASAPVRDWHVGPVFGGSDGLGHHQFVVEFLRNPTDPEQFRDALDAELSHRNADYLAHRLNSAALPTPALIVAASGSFEAWMRRRGKLGGQNKVPRMDNSGRLTQDLVEFLRSTDLVTLELGSTTESLEEPAGVASARVRA
jgi:hypothetical protein